MEKAAQNMSNENNPNIPMRLVNSNDETTNSTSGNWGTTKCLVTHTPITAGTPKIMAVLQSTSPDLCCLIPPTKAEIPTINNEYAVELFHLT